MHTKYVHPELGKEVEFGIAGYYTPQKVSRLDYDGRQVLYEVGRVKLESS